MDTNSQPRMGFLRRLRRIGWLAGILPAGGGLAYVAGCAAVAATLVTTVVASLLTGIFIAGIHAIFTTNTVAYTEIVAPQFFFHSPSPSTTSLVSFRGVLPGFHIVVVDFDDRKPLVSAQTGDAQAEAYQTEVEIDLNASPPLRGIVRACTVDDDGVLQCGGGEEFPLEDFYEINGVTREVVNEEGRRMIRINVDATGMNGEELDYTLELQARLSEDGRRMTGATNVYRAVTYPGQEAIETNSIGEEGSLEAEKTGEGTADEFPDFDDAGDDNITVGDTNDNAGDDNANDNGGDMGTDGTDGSDAGTDGIDAGTDGTDAGTDGAMNDNDNQNDNSGDSADNDNSSGGSDGSQSVAELCPGVPDLAVFAVTQVIDAYGLEGFDVNNDGFVTPEEVQAVINPAVAPLGVSLSDSAAACVAAIVNE